MRILGCFLPRSPERLRSLATLSARLATAIRQSSALILRDNPRPVTQPAVILNRDLVAGNHLLGANTPDTSAESARCFCRHGWKKRIIHLLAATGFTLNEIGMALVLVGTPAVVGRPMPFI